MGIEPVHRYSVRAVCEGLAGLEDLRLGPVAAVREADHRPDRDVRPGQDCRRPPDVGRPDADRRDVVLGRQPAAVLDKRVVQLGAEKRVINGFRDVALGKGVDAGCHVLT